MKVQWMYDFENRIKTDSNFRAYWTLQLLGNMYDAYMTKSDDPKEQARIDRRRKAWDRIIH